MFHLVVLLQILYELFYYKGQAMPHCWTIASRSRKVWNSTTSVLWCCSFPGSTLHKRMWMNPSFWHMFPLWGEVAFPCSHFNPFPRLNLFFYSFCNFFFHRNVNVLCFVLIIFRKYEFCLLSISVETWSSRNNAGIIWHVNSLKLISTAVVNISNVANSLCKHGNCLLSGNSDSLCSVG